MADNDKKFDTPIDTGSQALSEALRSSFGIIKFVMGLLVLVFAVSGVYQVKQQERAIVLRFGKPQGVGEDALKKPGPHWAWPYPIDEVKKISVSGIQYARSSTGWYNTTAAQETAGTEPPPAATLNPAVDGYGMTADQNIVHSRVTLTYRISDPVVYLFNFTNAAQAVTNTLDDALLYATAHYKIDDILRRDRIGFRETVQRRIRDLVEQRNVGITVEQCTVESIPPRQLKDAFNEVLKAELNRNIALSDARTYANQTTNKASADAQGRVNLAESERAQLVSEISSRAKQFSELLPKYRENPELFAQQRLTETLGRVLTNVTYKILVPESRDGKPIELRYNLNRELPNPVVESK